jgi:hypothetical protein
MAISPRFTHALGAVVLGVALGACSASPASPSTAASAGAIVPGTSAGGASAGAPSTAPGGSRATTGGGGGGQPANICALFTTADIGAVLGKPVQQSGPVAGEAHSCSWASDDLTNVYVYWTDPGECDDTKASLSNATSVTGADFAGANAALGATFAGITAGGTCYVVEVAPTERAPQAAALGQLLQQFVQRSGS